jgi:hypothetical protein
MSDDEPMRLQDIVRVAFPHGGMTVSGLRKEAGRGRLVIERIAGRDYTTMADIRRMRELCRVQPKVLDFTSALREVEKENTTSSSTLPTDDTKRAQDAAEQIFEGLKQRYSGTSPASMSRRPKYE